MASREISCKDSLHTVWHILPKGTRPLSLTIDISGSQVRSLWYKYCSTSDSSTSDGDPREVVSIKEQQEDYRAVIKYCRQQPEFDPSRVIAWGTSFSGAHVVKLASEVSHSFLTFIFSLILWGL